MENQRNYKKDVKEAKFDSYLTKTIILSSKDYFRKQMNITSYEKEIMDDENSIAFLQEFLSTNSEDYIETINNNLQLKSAMQSLSALEQSVIFLLFNEDLSQEEAAKILEIYSKTVSKIKIRAIKKLKDKMKGDFENE